jgi:hypothetical protein
MTPPPANQQSLKDEIADLERRLRDAKAQLVGSDPPKLADDAGPLLRAPRRYATRLIAPRSPPRPAPARRLRPPSRLLRLQQRPRVVPRPPQAVAALRVADACLPHVPAPLTLHARQHRAPVRVGGVQEAVGD